MLKQTNLYYFTINFLLNLNSLKYQLLSKLIIQQMEDTTKNQNSQNQGSVFKNVPLAPPDPIFGTDIAFQADSDQKKINLGNGVYRDNQGQHFVFPIVKKVEAEMISENLDKEYLPIDGLEAFVKASQILTFGENCQELKQGKIVSCQTVSGTGSLRLGFQFIAKYSPQTVYISNPTWVNHKNILSKARLQTKEYPYYNTKTRSVDIEQMVSFLQTVKEGSIILLHACAHNPTGFDPTQEEWKKIANVMAKRSLFPYFDSAYQGFATGDLQKDAFAIRYFLSLGFQMAVSVSFSKNMGLYGQRTGALHLVVRDLETNKKILSQLKDLARANYSNPPAHGARIAARILNNPQNKQQWIKQLGQVSGRIILMRKALRQQLQNLKTGGEWKHITDQIGMFSYTGLTEKQCELLIQKYHVYLLKTGRISVSGINDKNVKYLAQSMKNAIEEAP